MATLNVKERSVAVPTEPVPTDAAPLRAVGVAVPTEPVPTDAAPFRAQDDDPRI